MKGNSVKKTFWIWLALMIVAALILSGCPGKGSMGGGKGGYSGSYRSN